MAPGGGGGGVIVSRRKRVRKGRGLQNLAGQTRKYGGGTAGDRYMGRGGTNEQGVGQEVQEGTGERRGGP